MPQNTDRMDLHWRALAALALGLGGCASPNDVPFEGQGGSGGPDGGQPADAEGVADTGRAADTGVGADVTAADARGAVDGAAPGTGAGDAGGCPSGPLAPWHFAAGADLDSNGGYAAGAVGFNLADIGSASEASALPAGVMGLAWVGMCNGADASFIAAIQPLLGNPKVFGFYLMDEPDPTGQWTTLCPIAALKAESDWIHANAPGTKTFVTLLNLGSSSSPSYTGSYNPSNSGIDLYGVDPYPCRTDLAGCDDSMITAAIPAVESAGIALAAIVPVYQAFGGGTYVDDTGGAYLLPTPAQEALILSTWASVVPTPVFDFAYAWGPQAGDTPLRDAPVLQQTFAAHNANACGDP